MYIIISPELVAAATGLVTAITALVHALDQRRHRR